MASCITLVVVTALWLNLWNSPVAVRCSVHVYVNLFMGVFFFFFCKPLHNSLSRTATRGLFLSRLSSLMCRTVRHKTGLPYFFDCNFSCWYWRNGAEVSKCDALRAEIMAAHTFPSSLQQKNLSIPSVSSHHIFTLKHFLLARPAFWCPISSWVPDLVRWDPEGPLQEK